jgi:hypothetical protein
METSSQPPSFARPSLWNPNPACSWSLILSAALGAFLHHRNWLSLGMPAKAKNSLLWFYGVVAFFILFALVPDHLMPFPAFTRRSQFIILILWYFISGREQARYVRQHFPNGYVKKKWGKPLFIGFGAMIAYLIYSAVVSLVYDKFGINS